MNRGPIVIKLELDSLRQAISVALAQEAINIDEQIKAAIDEFIKEDVLAVRIKEATRRATELAVDGAISDFFKYGGGAAAIKEAVNQRLAQDLAKLQKASDEELGRN